MVKLFAMVELKEALTENLFARLQSYMNSRDWNSFTTGSNGITVRLPEGSYVAVFENDVNCLTIAEELKFQIEANVSTKGATVLVVKANAWAIAARN